MKAKKDKTQGITGKKNGAAPHKYVVAPGWETKLPARSGGETAVAAATPVYFAPEKKKEAAAPVKTVTETTALPIYRQDTYVPAPAYAAGMQEKNTAEKPVVRKLEKRLPAVPSPPGSAMAQMKPLLPAPTGRDEKEELRAESRIRTQLAKGVSPEELGARAELREQRLQNISAQELKKRQEQAVGHLNEVQKAIADLERQEREKTAAYDLINTSMAAGGLPYDGGEAGEETDKALYRELDKWQGIVNDQAARYYYRENQEQAAKLSRDRAGQEKIRTVEDILKDLRILGEVTTGQYGDRRDREALMAKYGLSERELEAQAMALMTQLQGELEKTKETVKDAGYDYDRMTEYQKRMEQIQRAIEGQKHTEEFAEKHPVLSSAASVLTSPVQGIDYFAQLAKGYGHSDPTKLESYVPANVYEMRATNFVRNVRGTVARGLEEKYGWSIGDQNVASFLYQTGMSMGDFLFNAMLTGNFSGGLGGTGTAAAQKAASNLSLAIMGSGAAANTTAEAIERGLSNRQAFTLGAVAGVAEILTEKVSLETLLDKTALGRNAMGYLLKNIAAEGSEEVASDLINWAADVLVAKDKSQWNQAIQAYEARGMGKQEAFQTVLKDQLISMAWSGIGGGLSGGVMAGGSVAINGYLDRGAATSAETIQTQKTAPVEGMVKLTPYSQDEAKNFLTGARNKVLGFGSDILEFVRRAISAKGGNERLYCGKLPQETADMIFESTGRDLTDFNFVISSDGVWHAYEHHGQDTKKTKGKQVSVRAEDMALLPEVIAKPDRVFESPHKDGYGRTTLIFEKTMGDTVVTITGISAGRKVLDFDSMRIMKERSPATSRADSTIDPSLTSKTSSGQTSLTDTIIPLMGDGVKGEFTQEGEGYTGTRARARRWSADSVVEAILTNPAAVETLAREAGIAVTEGMDEARRRAVVRQVVESLLEEEKTAAQGETESSYIDTDPLTHTPEQQKIIVEYQASADKTLKEFFKAYIEDPKRGFARHNISAVTQRQAEDIKRLLGGEYDGYTNAINSNGVLHILREHGPEGTVDHSLGDLNDISRLGHVLEQYDDVEVVTYKSGEADLSREFRTKDDRPAPMLKFSKRVDGTYYVIEAIPETKHKKLWVVSAYMEKADGGTQAPDAGGPRNTPDASLASSPSALYPIMPQEGKVVKGQHAQKDMLLESAEELEVEEDTYQDPLVREIWRVFGRDRPAEEEDKPYRSDDPIIQAIVDLDRSTRFARKEGTDRGLVFDEYVRTTLPCRMAERINTIAKTFGVRVRFVDKVENGVANASINGREILVEKNNKNPVLFLLGHEWIHRVQDLAPREYRAFREAIGEELYSRAEEVRALYERQGRSISYEQALNEAAADYAGRMLEDGRVLDEFIERHRGDRTVLERFAEAIRELIGVLTGKEKTQAQRVERKLRAAMEAAAGQVEKSGTAALQGKDGTRFSVKDVGGKKVVWLEKSPLTNRELDSHSTIAEYIAQHIGEVYTIIESGQQVYLGEELPDEYTQSGYTSYLRAKNRNGLRAKNKAVGSLGELIETATNRRWEKTKHPGNKDAKYGMYRYSSTFAFQTKGNIPKVRAYDVELLIRNASDGKKYLYDIVGIKENTTVAFDLQQRETRKGDWEAATQGDVSIDSISQEGEKSNSKLLLEGPEELEVEEEAYQDPLVREIWRVFGKDKPAE